MTKTGNQRVRLESANIKLGVVATVPVQGGEVAASYSRNLDMAPLCRFRC